MSLESRKSGATLEDPGAELLDRGRALVERYGRVVLGAIGAVVVIGVVAYLTVRANARQEEQAAAKLAEASALFWRGDYDRSLQQAQELSRQFGSTPSGNDAHRLAGDDAYWKGDFKMAAEEYRKYLQKNSRGLIAQTVQRSLAYSLENLGQPAEAMKLYDGLVGAFDRESNAEFLMAAARCAIALKQPAEAAKRLDRLVKEFPEASNANSARVMLAEISPPTP